MKRRNFLQSVSLLIPLAQSPYYWAKSIINTTKIKKVNKNISKKTDLQFKQAFPGLNGIDIMAHTYDIEPILVFTEYHMNMPVFGPHPHAGISVMTYMLPDSKQAFINRDSLGDFSYIEPGGLHITQAGSGVFHDEFPKETGVDTHGFQIWINHTEANRMVSPKAIHAAPNEIKEVQNNDYRVRIIHGEFEGVSSPYQLVTKVNIIHVFLEPFKSILLEANEMAFVYGLAGKATIDNTIAQAQSLINFEKEGNNIKVTAEEEGFEFMFCTAMPLNESIVYGGPFVMSNQEQMRQTQLRLANGEMGSLKPYKA